jgi:lipoprotein signal peptidase
VIWTLARPGAKLEAKDFQLSDELPSGVAMRRTLAGFAWIAGFFAIIVLAGFPAAVAIFLLAYLRLQAKESWLLSIVLTAVVWGAFYGLFDRMLHLPFPDGWLLAWLGFD